MPAPTQKIEARVEALITAVARRDWDGILEQLDPEVEYVPIEENVSYRGHHGMIDYFERWFEAWDETTGKLEEIEISPAGDQALYGFWFSGRGKLSGITTEARFFHVAEFRGGKFLRIREYNDRAQATVRFRHPGEDG